MRRLIALFFFIIHISTTYSTDLGFQLTIRPSGEKELSPIHPSSVNIHDLPSNVTLFSRSTAVYLADQHYPLDNTITIDGNTVTVIAGFNTFCILPSPKAPTRFILVRLENNQLKLIEVTQAHALMSAFSYLHSYFKVSPSFRNVDVAPAVLAQLATNQSIQIPPTYEASESLHRQVLSSSFPREPLPAYTP